MDPTSFPSPMAAAALVAPPGEADSAAAPIAFDQSLALVSIASLIQAIGPAGVRQVSAFSERLMASCVQKSMKIEHATLMLAFGGGKDSAYALSFARAAQLVSFARTGRAFSLKVVMFRHAGMTSAVMENAARAFDRLHIPSDPTVEVRLVEDGRLVPFVVGAAVPPALQKRNREALLIAGHLTAGAGRPAFCNDCNAEMVLAFDAAVSHWQPDFVLTGDSPVEQKAYFRWTMRMAKFAETDGPGRGFGSLVRSIKAIDERYRMDLHGPQLNKEAFVPASAVDPSFISLYDSTNYDAGSHRELLRWLGFRFGARSFVGTESDCMNPALMAHLRGLLLEQVRGQTYDQGLDEYMVLWRVLMLKKQIPGDLIQRFFDRYATPARRRRRRTEAAAFAQEAFGLDEEALIAICFAPFASRGRNLQSWLDARGRNWNLSAKVVAHAIEQGDVDDSVLCMLEEITKLGVDQIRRIYDKEFIAPLVRAPGASAFTRESGGGHFIVRLLQDDPHQVVVRTKLRPDGPVVEERISGR